MRIYSPIRHFNNSFRYITFFMQNNSKELLQPKNPVQIQKRETMNGHTEVPHAFTVGTVELSAEKPLDDYMKLMDEKLQTNDIVPDDVLAYNFKVISSAARDRIWKMLFEKDELTDADKKAIGDFLLALKKDACFYGPWEYNEWVVKLRDELLKREIFDFWRNQVVRRELGICWARDCDFFDEMEDPVPAEYYNHAGCVAPFKTAMDSMPVSPASMDAVETQPEGEAAATTSAASTVGVAAAAASAITRDNIANFVPEISSETPLQDYRRLIEERVSVDYHVDEELLQENFVKISKAMRDYIWNLLFVPTTLAMEQEMIIGKLMLELKRDCGFYSPWEYNTWVVKVRDELIRRNMLEFWREEMVKHELGPCWAKDSDYFDDMNDPEPANFYRHGGCEPPFNTNRDD